jgi:putative glycerol-1-phosphate prenyltransferase
MKIYNQIVSNISNGKKQIALLVDPDKCFGQQLNSFLAALKKRPPHLILVGGSLISNPIAPLVKLLKHHLNVPVVLYPGHPTHLSPDADALLFLSMISGRNAELLIGSHVVAAPLIKQYGIETIPTGYMLIDGGVQTSVEYISQTRPIPANKTDIAVATALAGEMLGLKLIYMDAGSGAINPVPLKMIAEVKKNCSIPLMIGGGIDTPQKLAAAYENGADLVVIGNALEKDPELLNGFMDVTDKY